MQRSLQYHLACTEVTVTAVPPSPAAGEDQFTARTAPTEVCWSVAAGVPAEPNVDTTAALQSGVTPPLPAALLPGVPAAARVPGAAAIAQLAPLQR